MAFGSLPNTLGGGGQASGAYLPGGGVITGSAGAITLTAGGTNQNITLTPSGTGTVTVGGSGALLLGNGNQSITGASGVMSFFVGPGGTMTFSNNGGEWGRWHGTGRFGIGTGATDSGALLQIGADTLVASGGAVWGTDRFFYRKSSADFAIQRSTDNPLYFYSDGTNQGIFSNVTANGNGFYVTPATNRFTIRTGNIDALVLDVSQNAIFYGTVKPILATTAGAPAYVKGAIYFDTTLNKLRVGGATAWETITSA